MDLIPPHGGVPEPINRTVAMVDPLSSDQIPVSDADLSTLYRIADGGLSPLTGPKRRRENGSARKARPIRISRLPLPAGRLPAWPRWRSRIPASISNG